MESDLNTTVPSRQAGRRSGHIAVTSLKRHGRMRLPIDYVHALRSAGAHVRVFSTFRPPPGGAIPGDMEVVVGLDPEDTSPLDGAAGLLLPGGGDIDPDIYGRERHAKTHNVNRRRDRFELTLVAEALDRNLPVLAVCRGMQLLNVHLGGTLVQHIPDNPKFLDHGRDRPRAEAAHHVRLVPNSRLAQIFATTDLGVNSHHHQGLDDTAPALKEVGWAEDGVLEAVESTEHDWVVGVQWHPEVMAPVDDSQMKLFRAFVAATRGHVFDVPVGAARPA